MKRRFEVEVRVLVMVMVERFEDLNFFNVVIIRIIKEVVSSLGWWKGWGG